jgi:hypothetical protein
MIRSPLAAAPARLRRIVLAGLALSAVVPGAGATAASAQGAGATPPSTPTLTLPPFWDVGVSPGTRNLVDGQELTVFSAAQPHEGGFFVHQCSGPFDADGVICERLAGPVDEARGFVRFTVKVKGVLSDEASGRRVDCRVQNTCTLVVLAYRRPDKAFSLPIQFVPMPPTSVAPPAAPPAVPPSSTPQRPGKPAEPVVAQPRFTG